VRQARQQQLKEKRMATIGDALAVHMSSMMDFTFFGITDPASDRYDELLLGVAEAIAKENGVSLKDGPGLDHGIELGEESLEAFEELKKYLKDRPSAS